ncbi:pancreatic progenitor cell differentiation and proliferation factor-like [Phoca vitulina]|uniref:pancreatic progenitor cell differentiation and proliferation factor-like n=1 Tax=Phoca vitulina TaxID=9720 RepID=UPI00139664D0|nr:pancreatic progenitor cell differentiation and proliferation factor-like [Phoca vitulina]XP_035940060.1 pancreatic progenitor cell differentiation and proliferation factor-like [Halichoerus grypus]
MATIPSSGSLVATHDYHLHPLGSTSSNSSCRSAEYPGEAILQQPGLLKAHQSHWWASFSSGTSTLPYMAIVLESPECSESPQASRAPSPKAAWQLAWQNQHGASILDGHHQPSGFRRF